MKYGLILLAIVCGAIFPIQAGLNVKLTKLKLNPIMATFYSAMIGFITILFCLYVFKVTKDNQ